MARMLPSVISPEVRSSAERRIFDWFRDAPGTEEWIVLHSLGIANHSRVIHGEVDFFVLVPRHGLFAIEVKGGRVKRENGIWYYTDKHGHSGQKERGPFDQANDGVFSIIGALKKRLDAAHMHIAKVFFGIGVMFPDIEYETVGIDEEQWQVFDCNDDRNVRDFILRVAEGSRKKWEDRYGPLDNKRLPSKADIEYIASLLRGDFDKAVSISVQLRNAEDALIELTNEQYRCLDQMDDNPRNLIQGPAGTGKTNLAIEDTKRAAAEGKHVALFCFNTNLGDWMREYFAKMPANLQPAFVGTFHSYMMGEIRNHKIPVQQPDDEEALPLFYSEDVPEAAKKALQDKETAFDKIIIDEAQDLIAPRYLEVMDLCLKKGLGRGRWTMFGDFEMQAIFSGNKTGEELKQLLEDRTSFAICRLTVNCRNTKPICQEIQTVTGFKTPKGLWTKLDGPPVDYITYDTEEEQREKLKALLASLLENHISKRNITILSPYKRENSIVSEIKDYDIRDYRPIENDNISFCTIQGYKGLENMVIILTDVDSFQSEKLMYVALSRARSGLNILMSEKAREEYQGLMQRRFIQ